MQQQVRQSAALFHAHNCLVPHDLGTNDEAVISSLADSLSIWAANRSDSSQNAKHILQRKSLK
jgi:hypothetical protein